MYWFWIIIGVMLAGAMLVVMWPLYRAEKKLSATTIVSAPESILLL